MALIVVRDFFFNLTCQDSLSNIRNVTRYDTIRQTFRVTQVSNRCSLVTQLTDSNADYSSTTPIEDIFILSQCDGLTNYTFYTQNEYPFARVVIENNSTVCGYVAPLPPPTPLPPPPVCDLEVTRVATGITSFNAKDGSIVATLTTVNTGEATLQLLKDGILVKGVVIDLDVTNEFTFEGLEKGDYILKGTLKDFDCEDEVLVNVPDFSFDEKYFFVFCEKRYGQIKIKISIKERGYSGLTNEIKVADKQVAVISYPERDNENKFKAVLGSELELKFVATPELDFTEIYTTEEKKYKVDLTYFDNDEPIWSGYILPDQSGEPFDGTPYPVTIKATDGIKVLNESDFDVLEGRMTFLQGIKYCLDKTDLSLGFKTAIDIVNAITPENDKRLLNGLTSNIYGAYVTINTGEWFIYGNTYVSLTQSQTLIPDIAVNKKRITVFYATPEIGGVTFNTSAVSDNPRFPVVPDDAILIATLYQDLNGVRRLVREPFYSTDVLQNHTFDVKRFIKTDGAFTNCFEVLEYLCKQFTAQVKLSNGFWCIDNIGYKARGDVREYAYNNDLSVIYSNQLINLDIDLSCGSDDLVLSDGFLTNGAGYKKSVVKHVLGYPQPVIVNGNFEDWTFVQGKEVPANWGLTQPYDFFTKSSKYNRFYDPTTGDILTEENGSYYFSFFYQGQERERRYFNNRITPRAFSVFNRERVSIAFQLIVNDSFPVVFFPPNTTLSSTIPFHITIGNYKLVNAKENRVRRSTSFGFVIERTYTAFEAFWKLNAQDDEVFRIEVDLPQDINPYNNFTENTNINFDLLESPIQGFMQIVIAMPNLFYKDQFREQNLNLQNIQGYNYGFDNFKITKTSPISGAKTIEDETIEVLNANKYTTVPDAYEVFFGDVSNNLRTDGIKTNSGIFTSIWKRKSLAEAEPINNLVAREILSQYQNTFRIFEGDILAEDINIRSVLNLPTFDLFKFAILSGSFDLIECRANLNMAEIYSEEGSNSGAIGGGSGIPPGGNINNNGLILGFKNKILTDGNNNLFLADDGI